MNTSKISENFILLDGKDAWDFFKKQVEQAQKYCHIKLNKNIENYLVKLLYEFISISENEKMTDCLAFILKKALESNHVEKAALYKKLGDTSIYFAGFFQEYFNNKMFDIKYYQTMGIWAYQELSTLVTNKDEQKTYIDLSKNFNNSIDILLCISQNTFMSHKDRSLLSLYDAWLNTASKKLELELLEKGVFPIKTNHRGKM